MITIQPYTFELVPAVRSFNGRLRAAGCPFEFPEHDVPAWLPGVPGRQIYQEFYLALDDGCVRGAYILKHQMFTARGQDLPIAYYHLPISEGLIDRRYRTVGVQLLRDALRRQPRLFALGMGGYEQPLPRLLMAMRWSMSSVPFYFKVNHPAVFLRNIQPLRGTALRRLALDTLALSGLGWVGLKTLDRVRRRSRRGVSVEVIPEFASWADTLWDSCRTGYSLIAVRDSATLNILYPKEGEKFIRLRIADGGSLAGWAVVLDTKMSGHKQFGDLRVGTIADCLAAPEDAAAVIAGATKFLREAGTDLIVSNQAHDAWCAAMREAGFLAGPSNFIFAASEKLGELLIPFDSHKTRMHLTRGDGDGPIHL